MLALPQDTVCEIRPYHKRWVVAMCGPYGYLNIVIRRPVYLKNGFIESSCGFTESRLRKMAIGVTTGFKRFLRIRGVGYHLKPEENMVTVIAGFSYDVQCLLHPSIQIKPTRKFAMIKARSKYVATTTNNFALMRGMRKADIYRGLGIYYRYEKILYKPGSKQK